MRAYVPVNWLARAPDQQVLLNSRESLRSSVGLILLDSATGDERGVVLLREEALKRLRQEGGITCL